MHEKKNKRWKFSFGFRLHPLIKIWMCPSIIRPYSSNQTKISIFCSLILGIYYYLWIGVHGVVIMIVLISLHGNICVDSFHHQRLLCKSNYPVLVSTNQKSTHQGRFNLNLKFANRPPSTQSIFIVQCCFVLKSDNAFFVRCKSNNALEM